MPGTAASGTGSRTGTTQAGRTVSEPRRTLFIELACSELRLGIWCDRCLTSARYEQDIYMMDDNHGPSLIGTASGCARCEHG
jgi:hypothetical protein